MSYPEVNVEFIRGEKQDQLFFKGPINNQSRYICCLPKVQNSIQNLLDISNICDKYEFCESFSSHLSVLDLYILSL